MGWISDSIVQRFWGAANIGIFVRVDTDDPIRVWFGLTAKEIGIDAWDADGTRYAAGGQLISIPDELDALINGLAARWEVGFSGVQDAFLELVEAGAVSVKGRVVHIGFAPLDFTYDKVSEVIPLVMAYADYWYMRRIAGTPTKAQQQQIALSVGQGDTARRRPARVSWTSTVQKLFSPTDTFCDRTVRYVPSYLISWPRF